MQYSGLFMGLSLYSYHVRELLVCWLFFSLPFVLLCLILLGGVIACDAGRTFLRWVGPSERVTPGVAAAVELGLKTAPSHSQNDNGFS